MQSSRPARHGPIVQQGLPWVPATRYRLLSGQPAKRSIATLVSAPYSVKQLTRFNESLGDGLLARVWTSTAEGIVRRP